MKNKLLLVSLCCFFTVFFSCKNETPIDELEIVRPEAAKANLDFFKVKLNVVVKKDDDFALFYTTDGTTDFKTAPIWQAVKGSADVQEINYSLPQNTLPTQLRLDFGLKQNQEDITLKSIVLEYKDKKREISGPELAVFFRADPSKCSFDGSTIKAVVNNGVKESPSLYPQESFLGPELKKLEN